MTKHKIPEGEDGRNPFAELIAILEGANKGRVKWPIGIRLFKDQIETLRWLAIHKYRSNRSGADLVRDAVDQFLEAEVKDLPPQ